MVEFVEYVAKELVDNPDAVKVTSTETDRGINILLNVLEEDMGKVIGRQGRIAQAMRSILKAISMKENKEINLEIKELEHE
ncbi:MAG: KH domain-containing protein [Tissierellia bacterium]|nr:KH domain-containing protein [Tissierellia bacterium]